MKIHHQYHNTVVLNYQGPQKEWEILVNRKVEDVLDVPNISKAIPFMKWTEYFTNDLHHNFGEKNIMLSYVIRESDTVPCVLTPMMRHKSYS